MYFFLSATLSAERDDAHRNIEIRFSLPRQSNDMMQSRITVVNDSAQNLTDRHLLTCESIFTVNPGGLVIQGMVSAHSNKAGGGWYVIGGQPRANEIERSWPISGTGATGNADATTESCLAVWNINPAPT